MKETMCKKENRTKYLWLIIFSSMLDGGGLAPPLLEPLICVDSNIHQTSSIIILRII